MPDQDHVFSWVKVVVANAVGVGAGITLSDVHLGLSILAVSITICYGVWKWRDDYKYRKAKRAYLKQKYEL